MGKGFWLAGQARGWPAGYWCIVRAKASVGLCMLIALVGFTGATNAANPSPTPSIDPDSDIVVGENLSASRSAVAAPDAGAGLKVTLQLQDADIPDLLQLLAHQQGISVLISHEVSGTLTINLVDVGWQDAWSTVLQAAGLGERLSQGVRYVAPAQAIAERETQSLSSAKTVEQLAPLHTDVLRIRYARANHILKHLKSGQVGLSERGQVFVDERLNALIIQDLPARVAAVSHLVRLLDIPLSQVAIEARIVTASDSLNRQLGIAWRAAFDSETAHGDDAGAEPTSINSLVATTDLTTPLPASTLALGILRPGVAIDAQLSFLVEQGQARILAKPKILTIDQSLASIQSGVQIPYQETSRSGATSTSFKDAVLSLHVRPQITPDNNIMLSLNVKQDTIGQIFNGVPSINTNEMQTNVLVGNGQTLVLGGILQEDANNAERKTPILGDLPVLGRLFRRKITRKDQQELLVFITPTLVPQREAPGGGERRDLGEGEVSREGEGNQEGEANGEREGSGEGDGEGEGKTDHGLKQREREPADPPALPAPED